MKPLMLATLALSLAVGGFAAGRLSAPHASEPGSAAHPTGIVLTQNSSPVAPQQSPDDPRELIPLTPGQQPGQGAGQQPGQQPGQAPGECPVQIYQDGKLYTFPQPGQQPGQGAGPQPGQPGQPQELIPLGPGNGGGGGATPSNPVQPSAPPTTPLVNPGRS